MAKFIYYLKYTILSIFSIIMLLFKVGEPLNYLFIFTLFSSIFVIITLIILPLPSDDEFFGYIDYRNRIEPINFDKKHGSLFKK